MPVPPVNALAFGVAFIFVSKFVFEGAFKVGP